MQTDRDVLRNLEESTIRLAEAKQALRCARRERNAAVAYAHKCGVRQTTLAEHLGVSQTRVHQFIAQAKEGAAS